MLTLVSPELEEYSISKTEPTSRLLQELVATTHKETSLPIMLTGPIEGRFLKMMVQVSGARRVLEIGTFTGYSALSLAEGLPEDGQVITCDLDPHCLAIARSYFARSEDGKKIKVLEGPALESIKSLSGTFDLVFIDADKVNYINYYEATLPLVKSGGIILIDNVLYSGQVVSPNDANSKTIAELNDLIARDERVNRVLLPFRDGVFFVRKK